MQNCVNLGNLATCPKSELRRQMTGPAHGQDLSESRRRMSACGPTNGSWLFGTGILSCGKLPAFFYGEEKCPGHTGICQDWQDERLGIAATLLQIG